MKTQYCPFLGVGLRSSESFVAWAQQCFFGKEGFVPGGGRALRRVPRRGTAAASSGRAGTKRGSTTAGLVPGETAPTPRGPCPSLRVKQRLVGFAFADTKYRAERRFDVNQKVHLGTRSLHPIFPWPCSVQCYGVLVAVRGGAVVENGRI